MDKELNLDSIEDIHTTGESYSTDFDIELNCELLGKMRQLCWAVI